MKKWERAGRSTAPEAPPSNHCDEWYAHLTAVALIDGTAAAIHFVAFPDSGAMQIPSRRRQPLGRIRNVLENYSAFSALKC